VALPEDEGHFIANLQARQTGKTFNGMAKLLWIGFRYPGSEILVTAPKYDQAKNVAFKALGEHLERMRGVDPRFFDYVVGRRNVLRTLVRFRNGTVIRAESPVPETIKEHTAKAVYLMEARARGATMKSLNADLSQRDTTIQGLEEQVRERSEHVVAAKAANAELRMLRQASVDRAIGAEARVIELQELTQQREQEITALKAKERAMQDDFSHLDGVGPKISATLRSVGVKTFAKLAAKEVDDIRGILVAKNPSLLKLSDPTTWPEQAGMAAEGRWDDLKALQGDLKERRRRERLSLQESPVIETHSFVGDA
jgi:predicted flap endonuclease-1-like 5' DNA nuclease